MRQKTEKGQPSKDEKERGPVTKDYDRSKYWCRTCNKPHPEQSCNVRRQACFNCGSTDHWRRDCPYPPKEGSFGGRGGGPPGDRGTGPFESRSGGVPSRGGGRGPGQMTGRTGGQGNGRNGNRPGIGGGGRVGVHAVELDYEDLGKYEGEEDVPSSTTLKENLTNTSPVQDD